MFLIFYFIDGGLLEITLIVPLRRSFNLMEMKYILYLNRRFGKLGVLKAREKIVSKIVKIF